MGRGGMGSRLSTRVSFYFDIHLYSFYLAITCWVNSWAVPRICLVVPVIVYVGCVNVKLINGD